MPNVLADFRYDTQGRLVEKVANGTTARYYHDDAGRRTRLLYGTAAPFEVWG